MNTYQKNLKIFQNQWMLLLALILMTAGFGAGCRRSLGDLESDVTEPNIVIADETAPRIVSTSPVDNEIDVAITQDIAVSFSEDINPLKLTSSSFFVTGPGSILVDGEVTLDTTGQVATFTPATDLDFNTLYTATITTTVEDLVGNAFPANVAWQFTTGPDVAQTVAQESVPLGSSSNFAILASAAITNIATSTIVGDVGLAPDAGSNISGFSSPATCPEVTGNMYVVDASGPACALISPTILSNAKNDAEDAFMNARDSVRGTPTSVSGNLNGLTLYPGLYESATSLELSPSGYLYLDAQGDGEAVFVIRSATTITTEASSKVVLTNGANASNVYWTAGSSITLGVNSSMKGTLIAGTSISLLTGATLEGRALNQGTSAAAITLDQATITVPSL